MSNSRPSKAFEEIQAILGLNHAETGHLFRVDMKTVRSWHDSGVPASRAADVERVADVVRALHARFVSDRVPHIAREPLPGLNGRTILEAIRIDGPAAVLEMLDRAFAYVPK